jgi:hypothetical protein
LACAPAIGLGVSRFHSPWSTAKSANRPLPAEAINSGQTDLVHVLFALARSLRAGYGGGAALLVRQTCVVALDPCTPAESCSCQTGHTLACDLARYSRSAATFRTRQQFSSSISERTGLALVLVGATAGAFMGALQIKPASQSLTGHAGGNHLRLHTYLNFRRLLARGGFHSIGR